MGSAVDRILSEQRQAGPGNIDLGQPTSKVDSILSSKPSVDDILGGAEPEFDPNRLLPRQVPIPAESDDPGLWSVILEALKEQGKSMVQFGKYAITSPGWDVRDPASSLARGKIGEDILRASSGDKEAEQRVRRGLEGGALTTSTLMAGGLASAIKPAVGASAPLLKRAVAWLAAEELGAVTYGAVAPLEDDETRAEAIKEDMIQFPIAGAAMHGIFKAAKLVFKGFRRPLEPALEDALKGMGKADAEATAKRAMEIVREVGDVPPHAETWVHSEATAQAVKERLRITARVADEGQPPKPDEPDFTVGPDVPPPPGPINPLGTTLSQAVAESEAKRTGGVVSKRSLGPISEDQFQRELGEITPKPPTVVDPDAAARARVEAARTTPFPDIPSGITEPLGLSVVREPTGELRKVFHGSSSAFEKFDPSVARVDNLYGPGIYFTANPKVASSYATEALTERKNIEGMIANVDSDIAAASRGEVPGIGTAPDRQSAITRYIASLERVKEGFQKQLDVLGDSPNVRPSYLDIRVPFDIDATYTVGELNSKFSGVGVRLRQDLPFEYGDDAGKKLRGSEVYDDLVTHFGDKEGANHALQEAGYDGITHMGGKLTAKGRALAPEGHRVYIAFSPDQVVTPWEIDLQRAMAQAAREPGDVADAAVADAVADAVVAEMKPVELMPPSLAQQATEFLVKGVESPKAGYSPLSEIGSISNAPPGAGPELNWDMPREEAAKLTEDGINQIKKKLQDFLNSDAGAVSGRAATRIAATGLSGASFYAAEQQDDPMAEALLNTVGGILALGSLIPGKATKKWLAETNFSYRVIKAFAADRIASDGTKKGMQEWQGMRSQGQAFAKQLEKTLRETFPDDLSKKAAMYSLDEGPAAPEFATLTPTQQREVASQAVLNNVIGRILTQLGVIQNPRVHYVRHLFQDSDTQNLWYSTWQQLGQSGQFAKQRQFETLREAEKWAQATGRKGPVMDPAKVQAYHTIEVVKAISNVRIKQAYERLGLLQDFDPVAVANSQHLSPAARLRQVRITNLGGMKMAPDDAATVLERAADGAAKFGLDHEYWQALDAAKGQLMRGIMFWAWEHGINVARGAAAIDGTGVAYLDALKRVKAADPVILTVSKYTNLYHRPDFGPEGQTLFDKAMAKLGTQFPTLAKVGTGFEHWRERGERQLWDEWVPALGVAAWTKEMHNWAKRTGGRHGIGSPEYEAAAQAAGKFASNAMGKIPELVQSPTVAFIMRQILFSPQWTRGRIAIMAHATGEIQKIMSGEINPREARYLAYKFRSVLLAGALTAIGSYALTQEWPQFNPNTLKFYVKTGVKDHNGREIGLDLTGWWQDDLKVYNDPWAFVRDRQNPLLRAVGTQVNGRDVFGRPITGMERLENIIGSVGPPGELALGVANTVSQGELSGAEAIRLGSGLAAVGNVATLPRATDAIVSKMAAKVLRQAGLPDDKDRVYQLSRLMRQNFAQTGALYGGEINTWLAYQRRAYKRRGIPWLWQEGKEVLRDMAK